MPDEDDDDELTDEEIDGPEDLEEEDLEDLDEDDDVVDLDDDDELEGADDTDADTDEDLAVEETGDTPVKAARDEDDEDEEDEEDSDDVEASLDVILKERMVVADDEDDDEDEDSGDPEDRGETPPKVLPKQPGEFVCQSCFLVKHPSQLADRERVLCRDCV